MTHVHSEGCTLARVMIILVLFNCNFNTSQSIHTVCPDSLPYPSQYCSDRNANGIKGSHNK